MFNFDVVDISYVERDVTPGPAGTWLSLYSISLSKCAELQCAQSKKLVKLHVSFEPN